MIWGCVIVAAAILLLMPTNVLLGTYQVLAIIAFTLFGLGLAFYATPSTDAALSNLPDDQAGAGSGIYKMASSLGASFGVAISAAIFTALSADQGGVNWLPGVLTFAGRQDNRRRPRSGDLRLRRQPPDDRRGDHLDHAAGAQGQGRDERDEAHAWSAVRTT